MKIFFTLKKESLVLIILALLIAIFYGNTLSNGFVHDDMGQIADNQYAHSLEYLPKVVTGCIWEYELGGCKGRTDYYRPFQSLSYLLTYQISKEARFFHLINLAYLLTVTFLIFTLAKILTRDFLLAFLSALFFLINPINNEVINWASAVPELAFTAFILLSTIFYVKFRKTSSKKKLCLAYVFYFLGILSKEPAVFLPIVFLFIDWSFFNVKFLNFNFQKVSQKEKKLPDKRSDSEQDSGIAIDINLKEFKIYSIFIALFLAYFSMRTMVIGTMGKGGYYYGEFTSSEKIYSFFILFKEYVFKNFYSYPLNFFHKFQKISDFSSYEFLFSLFVFMAFVLACFFLIKKREKFLSFAFVWFFVFISPALIFLDSLGENIFSERYVFASNIGFAFAVSCVFTRLWKKNKASRRFLAILLIAATAASWAVISARNNDWKDSETIYKKTLSQNPGARPLKYNLGVLDRQKGDLETARIGWEEMEKNYEDWIDINRVYNNLGDYHRINGDFDKAEEYYRKAADTFYRNGNLKGYNNLGAIYLEQGKYLHSLIPLCKALEINPEEKSARSTFEIVSFLIESLGQEDLPELYKYFTDSGIFEKSEEKKFRYKGKRCEEKSCFYLILSNTEENEIILPFLIMARTPFGEMIKIKNTEFNPQSREIILEIFAGYKESAMTFMFPSCEGIYYETKIPAGKGFIGEEIAP